METSTKLEQRMPYPAVVIPEAMKPIQELYGAASQAGAPAATLHLVHLRAATRPACTAPWPPWKGSWA